MGDFLNVDDFAHAFEEIHALLERARSYGFLMSQNEMKLAAETAIALEEMLRRDDLDSDAREALESWHSHTLGALAGGIDLKFFWMIGYYAQNLHNGEYPRQYGPMAALTAIRALEHAGEHLKPECTVRNNLEAGLEKLSYWADRCLPDHIGDTGLMWLLWGAVDTMATMNHHGGNAAKAWARITTQIEHHRDAIEDAHHGSAVLGYANSVLRRTKIDVAPFSGPFHETELSIAFNALESAARGDAIDIPEDYPSPPRS
ncbi:MAG: hypothetical protein KY455_09680, partial [Euryarchaeota archaeon]|nr:hypothetical protein [Euryarchaeota archaeon]